MDRTDLMRQIRDEVIALKASPLYQYRIENRYKPVIGQGNHDADIIFIGEGPGKNEAETGVPFCGASGRILDELLASIELPRAEVYVANIIKDRPPGNRDPRPEEIELYGPFLDRQIEIIEPRVIATLGRFSMTYILQRYNCPEQTGSIGQLHGKIIKTVIGERSTTILPLYHPAVAVYNRNMLNDLKKDFVVLKSLI
ncbi:MAG: uracil-DNA glycosylase [Candidatus Yanofskybacteria bacterium CG10_big_fil_rev_8_21_14_0_10_46_23]|uniref:Type-4 uracil-DNA glycosylase n=1 Tax=Candidatus Yanofskybacteria bacterium CG10_big_fil_rev_8_21_14_0_10_46_23 TaxID=1975098 RepID=A0A2H0R4T3_9BACT|nr:MAG: uracil-DNA glycosylase [Candidatus Yanofskybacteria bacterium CG10_big_fil_rev_8_21_14_0_10_46_23]